MEKSATGRWRPKLRTIWVVIILVAASVTGGLLSSAPEENQPSVEMANEPVVRDFAKALQLIEEKYVVAPDKERLTRAAVGEMLHTLDPHSNFFDRRDFSEMQDEQSSKFYGIGVTINQRNGRIYVIGVSQGMPADRAGLRYGDAIMAVDGESAKDWSQSDALKRVRGERGTEVEITVERAGAEAPLTVRIKRDEVPFPSVRNFFMLRPGIGYIGLTGGFNQETTEELRESIGRLREQGLASLILDLRRNPGGLLKQAIQVAETFLPKGIEIVSVRGREGRYPQQVYRSDNGAPETMPLVVLINGETASASEIVAGAMQDRDRAWIVGEESFGKGLVQTVFRLRGGTGLTLTTAKYYTPSGRSIQRAYNGVGFYNYFYSRRGENGEPNGTVSKAGKSPDQAITSHTQLGREVLSGGGIKPDTFIKMADENIRIRDACFEFARLLVVGLLPELSQYKVKRAEAGYKLRGNEYQLNDQVFAAFRAYVREHHELQMNENLISKHLDYIRRRIRAEIITAAYGIEIAEQFLIEGDEQAMRAVDEIPKAKHLSDQAHLFPENPGRQ
ncbi:MAG TPA: S41 family peptidase [Blastocatellia bacterium]|nr:S41 family peptidase [Blastocatellia bacterium]